MQRKIAGLKPKNLERFVLRARRAVHLKRPVNVLVTSSSAMQSLNRRFLGKNKATDVLSFPAPPSETGKPSRLAGDIAISADVAARNARTICHSPMVEVKILVLHGILHLAGFDHERDNGQMARKETKLRRELRLPVGLIERSSDKAMGRSTK